MFDFEKPITLAPAAGGNCLVPSALRTADLIVSTTGSWVSGAIRIGTKAVVSHALLCINSSEVVEAIGEGVVRRSIDAAVEHGSLAVAYRVPNLDIGTASKVVNWAVSRVGTRYSEKGALVSADKLLCRVVGPQPGGFFCSQLVIEAFKQAGVNLTELPSQCVTPGDVSKIAIERLKYVGHLKGDPAWFPIISP
ncbi:hypothetical protein [Novosphingobium sp.]|uniref:hypothetical protein n=1 Tax=Novosphingobium sp. TaxID=1874826 RepID=UPI0026306293|nr:hypothetical protein [Novosphingobium sp.]